ncbi:MCP four helix bundle domain-containing protein [Duganella sp. LX20W]|uniref:MCP four helix bundle domain-containing protein n=1 Tax=Rugamonas brunnea TaxID=2758569 RepID=A0A7W2IB29_9BURK|nr:methyl-accepting chemotaxis protein [Rugamonas brunnea]MBA5636884.1 MCP four helix bundle domain-containing protein [Rugamonas brunnea]
MKLINLKIGTRLTVCFTILVGLLILNVIIGLSNLSATNQSLVNIVDSNNVKVAAANDMSLAQRRSGGRLRNILIYQDPTQMAEEQKKMQAADDDYAVASKKLHELVTLSAGKDILARIDSARDAALPLIAKVVKLGLENKNDEVPSVLANELSPAVDKWQAALKDMATFQANLSTEARQQAERNYDRARLTLSLIAVIATAAAIALAWMVTRSITRPLNAAVRVARTVGEGDLTGEIKVMSTDETGQLLLALKAMNDKLVSIVGQVREGTDAIATGTSQIASGNLDLSTRTEQQASALEETASSMEQMTSTVRQNADNARQANALAGSASEIAVKGGQVVSQVVETMGSIDASARKIVEIISVIDGIAFQTNILALNAAVEAARAGEQGRGFAVVASEVRNLAQRSAAAAKEIKSLIDDSVQKVSTGNQLVNQAGATMEDVVASVKRVTDIMAEIASASQEQESGIGQINQAVTEMDNVTQQNAALVEEAASASASLQEQANQLAAVVSIFKLDRVQRTIVAPTAIRQAPQAAQLASAKPVRNKAEVVRIAADQGVRRKAVANADADWEEF